MMVLVVNHSLLQYFPLPMQFIQKSNFFLFFSSLWLDLTSFFFLSFSLSLFLSLYLLILVCSCLFLSSPVYFRLVLFWPFQTQKGWTIETESLKKISFFSEKTTKKTNKLGENVNKNLTLNQLRTIYLVEFINARGKHISVSIANGRGGVVDDSGLGFITVEYAYWDHG